MSDIADKRRPTRGRKPFSNREDVRTSYVSVMLSPRERDVLLLAVEARREERRLDGQEGAFTPSAYFRELLWKEHRHRRTAKSE